MPFCPSSKHCSLVSGPHARFWSPLTTWKGNICAVYNLLSCTQKPWAQAWKYGVYYQVPKKRMTSEVITSYLWDVWGINNSSVSYFSLCIGEGSTELRFTKKVKVTKEKEKVPRTQEEMRDHKEATRNPPPVRWHPKSKPFEKSSSILKWLGAWVLKSDRPGFKSWHCYNVTVYLGVNYLTFLKPQFTCL